MNEVVCEISIFDIGAEVIACNLLHYSIQNFFSFNFIMLQNSYIIPEIIPTVSSRISSV